MKGSDSSWLRKAQTAFKTGDKVEAFDYATNKMRAGKVEGVFEHFVIVLFNKGYRQCYTWIDVHSGLVKKKLKGGALNVLFYLPQLWG